MPVCQNTFTCSTFRVHYIYLYFISVGVCDLNVKQSFNDQNVLLHKVTNEIVLCFQLSWMLWAKKQELLNSVIGNLVL